MNRSRRGRAWLAALVVSCWLAAPMQAQNVGTIVGTVTDPTGAVIAGARVSVTSAISGYRQTTITDARGQYRVANLPFGQFTVHGEAAGFTHVDQTGELRSNVPMVVNLQLNVAQAKEELTVTEAAPLLETTATATHHDLDYVQLGKLPVAQASRAMAAIVESVPGVVQDDNGRLHARGSESQVQYVVDGVPITENLAGVFSTALDTRNLRSAEIITGNVPAEYGDKLSAVIHVNTKSGLEMPWSGSVSLGAGSFDTAQVGGELGGHLGKFGMYIAADGNRTRRYLDPPEIANFRNVGGYGRLFTRFDYLPSENDSLRISLSVNGTDFQVPNHWNQQMAGQRQKQQLRDNSQSFGWNHVLDPNTVFDLVLFRRASTARLLDAQRSGTPYFAEQDRSMRNEGLRANLSREWKRNSVKVGMETHRWPLTENFRVAATGAEILADETNPVSAYPLSRPFVFGEQRTGRSVAVYAQDRMRLPYGFTADFGVRFDHYNIATEENAVSPRVGLAYFSQRTGTVLRASYNRLFQTPPLENLLLSSAPAAGIFADIARTSGVRAVPAERTNFYEFGMQQQLGAHLRLDITRYVKNARNFSDKDQFLNTGIIFPIAVARGDVRGTEMRLDLAVVRGFTAFVSYANSKTISTTPLAGGLFLGQASDELLRPGVQFLGDHDQRNTAHFGVTYTHRKGSWVSFSGRHDSGVPSDFDPEILRTLDGRIQRSLDAVRGRVKPRTVFDVATGLEFFRESQYPVTLQLGVDNLFDRFYLYNFESVFSGTHIGRPREISARIVLHWKSRPGAQAAGD